MFHSEARCYRVTKNRADSKMVPLASPFWPLKGQTNREAYPTSTEIYDSEMLPILRTGLLKIRWCSRKGYETPCESSPSVLMAKTLTSPCGAQAPPGPRNATQLAWEPYDAN